jgi:hypothetical protein
MVTRIIALRFHSLKLQYALIVRQLEAVLIKSVPIDRVLASNVVNDRFFDEFTAFDAGVQSRAESVELTEREALQDARLPRFLHVIAPALPLVVLYASGHFRDA